ncbi:hypothetical protein FZC76_03105 [Sutcliffiella horikoshii]|uniref:Uncharacterized protein n=1 Tax=Sutcliffiella horikoshii TaxID=79883 RepID=A0A5D4T7M4_9BACI|nr:spore germination protein GerPC [Sutcliffiella horikoshii]TYS70901.1 hypothetical protein FZC76_03105 [Sutcliffiella horikoshii]
MSKNDELEKRVEDLEKRIEQLTTLFHKKGDARRQDVHYHIHTLKIGSAQIEKLDYHLDSIAIEQLSGTLNIGNNFDAKEVNSHQKPTFIEKKEEQKKVVPTYRPLRKKDKQTEDQRISVISRKSGFSVKINGKEES